MRLARQLGRGCYFLVTAPPSGFSGPLSRRRGDYCWGGSILWCRGEVDGDSAVGDGSREDGAVGSSNLACDPCCRGGGGAGVRSCTSPSLPSSAPGEGEEGRRGRKYPLLVALTVLVGGYCPCCCLPHPRWGGCSEPGWCPKTLDRRPCTGRSQEAVVIFLFGLEALLTRDSRVLSCAVSSFPKL